MKEFLAAHTVEAIGIVIAAITAIGVFVGPWFASWRQRKNTEQDRKLRAHFEELRREAQEIVRIMSRVTERYGKIVSHSQAIYSEITCVVFPQPSDSFMAHFPEETTKLGEYSRRIEAHNRDYEGFRLKIKTDFESKGIPVVQNDQRKSFTFIYEDVFNPLFNMWKELAQGRHPWPDFRKIDTVSVEGGHFLHPSGWEASMVAFAKTEDDSEKCRLALAEIADNVGNRGEAAKILDSANKLVEKAREFANQFAAKLDEIDRYWPGKQPNKFKRLEKTCQTCREL